MFGLEVLANLLDVVRTISGAFDGQKHPEEEIQVHAQPFKYTRFEHKHFREKCDTFEREEVHTEIETRTLVIENITINQYFIGIKNDQEFDFSALERHDDSMHQIEDAIRAVTDEANSFSRHLNDEVYSQSSDLSDEQSDEDQFVDSFDFTFVQDFGW